MDYQELIEQLRNAVISPFDLGPVADAVEARKYSGDDEPIKLIVKPGENK